ncbi:Transcription termination factor 2 [Thelohanellus kitauei]|uniref:Transcription termination factor 2 n=1 Tax=Thelohanellus kitauei TaxID=669202 RepID=A0A0C2JB43_THEKT|nr:Transcription termination factor 2 [Thelohanellus kitauei]
MDHQVSAIKWMLKRESCEPFGGILADDMGLGKTLTILAFLCQDMTQSSLVIMPMSVLHQWQQEIEKHLRDIKYIVYHGSDRQRYDTRLSSAVVVLTTYGTFASKVFQT